MSKTNAKVIIAMVLAGVLTWIALLVAALWGGYDTIGVWGSLLAVTVFNYLCLEEDGFDEAIKIVFSKEEESN